MQQPLTTATPTLFPFPQKTEMVTRILNYPWEATSLDAIATWSPTLRYSLRSIVLSGFPSLLLWGPEFVCLYNDAYREVLGREGKHPHILGLPASKAWPEVWNIIEPLLRQVVEEGKTCTFEDLETPFYRDGKLDTVYWTSSYSPVYGDDGQVAGVLVVGTETTRKVARFQHLVRQIQSPLVIYKGPDLVIEEANQALLDYWRKDRSIIGQPLQQVLPELEEQGYVQLLKNVYRTGETFSGREMISYFNRPDGSREVFYWNLEFNAHRETSGEVSGVIAMATDITEQVLARERLRITEDEMRVALEAADMGYWHVDPVNNTLRCNRKTKELFGLPPDEEVELALAVNQIHEDDRQRVIERIQTALDYSSGGFYDIEYRVIHPETGRTSFIRAIGKTYFDDQQRPYQFSGTVQDVTRSKEMEEELRRSEEKYRGLFENMDQGFCIIEPIFDDQGRGFDYRFVEYNSRFTEQSGLHHAVGKTMRELVPEIEDHWPLRYGEVVRTGVPVRFVEGSEVMGRWFDVFAFRMNVGNLVAVLFTDITERRRAEEKLLQQQRFTESILQAAPSLTYIYDLEHDGNAFSSPQVRHILGYSSEEVQAMGAQFLPRHMHPDDQPAAAEHLGKLLQDRENRIFTAEYRMRHKEGHWIWLYDRTRVFQRNADGLPTQVLGVATEITERKQAEEQLHQQQRFTQSIIEAAPSLTYIFDLTHSSNVFCSPQIIELLGYSREEVTAMGSEMLSLLLHPEDVALTAERFDRILADRSDEIHEVEYRMKHKLGNWIWLFDRARVFRRDEKGAPTQILGVATEITTRKEAEAGLQASESRFRTIADTLPQLVWVSDAEGIVQWQNLRNKEFFGDYHPGNDWMQFLHPGDVARTTEVWGESVRSGKEYEIEYRFLDHRTGEYRWFLVKALPLRDREGRIVNWFGTCTDIHDQKMMTERLEALVAERTRELQRSNEDLQQFAHVASHDLKEPVRKIRTFIDRLQTEMNDSLPERGKNYIDKVQRATARMSSMIDGVLQYSAMDSQQVLSEPVDLNRVLHDVESDLELAIQQKNAVLVIEELPTVVGSPVLLHQLFYNLINNSLKFSREGVSPHIRVRRAASTDPRTIDVVVSDNGIGFRNEDASRIFGTFIRLHSKDRYEGTGLGLALCQKIAQRHGGSIRAEGAIGEGAKFVVRLPVQE